MTAWEHLTRTSAPGFSEDLLDLVVYRKAASLCLREDYFSVDHDVELTCFTGLDVDFFTEARVE
jgi:hypothetical protein